MIRRFRAGDKRTGIGSSMSIASPIIRRFRAIDKRPAFKGYPA
jgi:hypothetical protein